MGRCSGIWEQEYKDNFGRLLGGQEIISLGNMFSSVNLHKLLFHPTLVSYLSARSCIKVMKSAVHTLNALERGKKNRHSVP